MLELKQKLFIYRHLGFPQILIILGFVHEIGVDVKLDIEFGSGPSCTMFVGGCGGIIGRTCEERGNSVDDEEYDENVVEVEPSLLLLLPSCSIEIVELVTESI